MYVSHKATMKMGKLLITTDFLISFCKMLPKDSIGIRNSQATLHPFVTYYLDLRDIHQMSYVVICDCLHHHNTVTAHLYQRSFIAFLEELPPARLHPKKIIYFSDDAAPQYKTGRISWICDTTKMILESKLNNIFSCFMWKGECGTYSEWNSQATSCSCQLARPYNDQLITLCQLFDWVCSNIPAGYLGYYSNEDYAWE